MAKTSTHDEETEMIKEKGEGGGLRKKGAPHKGTFIPQNKEKYIGKKDPIYRSSWEKRVFVWCDNAPNVVRWSSEAIAIPYTFNRDDAGREMWHRYFPDVYCEIKNLDGDIKKYLIEIKPLEQTKAPSPPKTKTAKSWKRYEYQMLVYIQNEAKWKFATAYCQQHNITFKLITEKTIFRGA